MSHHTLVTSSVKRIKVDGLERINFLYKSVQGVTFNFYTKNSFQITRLETGEYGAVLYCFGEAEWGHTTGTLMRRITLDYSTGKS